MTVYELIHELQKRPEDAEVLIYDKTLKWTNAIDDRGPLSETEHDDDDGTPIVYIYAE